MDSTSPGRKLGIAIGIAMLLAIPLFAVYLLIYDRATQSDAARASIAQGWGDPQKIAGPLLVIPYRVETPQSVTQDGKPVVRTTTQWRTLTLAPERLALRTDIAPERRTRSIYETIVYSARNQGHATYRLPADFQRLKIPPETIAFDRAEIRFGISDPRGVTPDGAIRIDGRPVAPQPGHGPNSTGGSGFFVPVDARSLTGAAMTVDFGFTARGHSRLTLIPRAGETGWTVRSPWPHPSFGGDFLPGRSQVTASGFTASYGVSNLAIGTTLLSDGDETATASASGRAAAREEQRAIEIALIQPVDLYAQINRAVKYGFLFVGFTFTALLMFDVIGGRAVSAVEYLLTGAALILFFVMLLGFAEVTGFAAAYLIAAGAIVGLLTAYSAAVLGSWRRGSLIATLLGGLYAVLYVLLRLEAYSLLIGSVLLFIALAAVMYLTRNLDWGRTGEPHR
ncbi:cell envelope integrity protein CreD [Sphingomonas sp.]|uniref:cell envelope integrity protein CreD n=1 Tax=Sphingomonas sp. TaxID=28214 RepID=UPI001EC47F64|nr:cell envelope integrity protein CreD [Sphingomonas sp.]MBX3593236.1 cell envelope integrity protein CreD [Sphingomonas sp.]